MNTKQKSLLILLLICTANSLALEQPNPSSRIRAAGGASGTVASDDITINCQLTSEAFSSKRAQALYLSRFASLKRDLNKLGINRIKSSGYSVQKSGQRNERDIYIASAKLEISTNTLTKSTQATNRLAQLSYIKNAFTLYNYSKAKVNKKIEELLDSAIVKAEEKALEQAESLGKFITRVIDSSIKVDADARVLKYASAEERARFRGKKGYKFINLEVFIVYGVEEFEEYQRIEGARGARTAAVASRSESVKSQRQSISQFRSAVRSKLLASAIRD